MSNKRIVYPIETTKRELEGVFLTALKIAAKGNTVHIGPKFELDYRINAIKPDVYIGTRADKTNYGLLKTLKKSGTHIAIVDTEGGIMVGDEYKTRHFIDGLKQVELFFAWGNKGKEQLSHANAIDLERIFISGAPWFDMKEVKPLYNDTIHFINEKYPKSFILFNSRLPFPNHKAAAISKEVAEKEPEAFAYYSKQFNNLNETIKKLAEDFPAETFIIRAHPSEDPAFYYEYFKGNKNIVINDDYNARAWVLASKLVLHNSCTTGLESAMLGKPVIAYQEVREDRFDRQLPNEASLSVNTYSDLKEKVQHYIRNPHSTYALTDDQTKKIKEFFYNVDVSASNIISEKINELSATGFVYRPDNEYRTIKTKMTIIYKYPILLNLLSPSQRKRVQKSKQYFMSKFKPFALAQLLRMKDVLADSCPAFKNIKIEKLSGSKYSYIIYP
jgi:surface carbohydrate biosynthesis protein